MTDPQFLKSQKLNGAAPAAPLRPQDPRLAELKTPDWGANTKKEETKNPFATEGAPAPKPAADDALAKRIMKLANDQYGLKLTPERIKELLLEAKADKSAGPPGYSPAETLALKALDRMGLALSHDAAKKLFAPEAPAPKPAPAALKPPAPPAPGMR